jgi:flavin reductase (DIM6/NTAB) family NADH-FMN oxidoreductase RutF
MPIDRDEFRQTLAHWASGVSVVTAREGDRLVGMTVSAFSSVSLSPPLVLVCASRASETCAVIQRTGYFAVNILAEQQRDLSQRFSDPSLEGRRFEGLTFDFGTSALPLLAETSASLECRVVDNHVAGDHRVIIGEVLHTRTTHHPPLLFLKSSYGSFVSDR